MCVLRKTLLRTLIGFRNRQNFSPLSFNSRGFGAKSYSKVDQEMKFILVTGGVISGVGKGVIASSFGTLLNCNGIPVTSLKIDPYINIDAGTFSPYEHGKIKTKTSKNNPEIV